MSKTVLVIDDDLKLNHLLKEYLEKFKFKVLTATHPDQGLAELRRNQPDIVILDVMLPDKDGFEVCKEIRTHSRIPIIMLTARGDVTDRVVGLELGADDYLGKPFEPRELVARIQSVLRRGTPELNSEILRSGNLILNLSRRSGRLGKKDLELTSSEFEILAFFLQNPSRVLNRDQLLEKIRGLEWEAFNRSIDVLISRLRDKLGDHPKRPLYIKTVWGTGYMFIGGDAK